LFPYFGADLRRRVLLVDPHARIPATAAWIVLAPDSAPTACRDAWRIVVSHPTGWRLYRRMGRDHCDTERPLTMDGGAT
jgi:hypothetical protein